MSQQLPQASDDRLFVEGGSGPLMGFVLQSHHLPEDAGLVSSGYKDAADILIDHLRQQGRDDGLVLPIVFCYRQYIEVQIKTVTHLANTFHQTGRAYRKTHDLEKLWDEMDGLVRSDLSTDEQDKLDAIKKIVMELHSVDGPGTSFRYPVPVGVDQIDLKNLEQVMSKVSEFLDSLGDMFADRV